MLEKNIDYISFDDLRNTQENVDTETYSLYLREIYNELSRNTKKTKSKGISLNSFTYYIKNIPIFIGEKLFYSFKSDNTTNYLSFEDFFVNMSVLKNGNYEECISLIFNLYDFGKSKTINRNDVMLLLSYIPLKNSENKSEYQYQLESLKEIEELIEFSFGKNKVLSFEQFEEAIEKKANLFIIPLVFLYLNMPILDKSMAFTKEKTSSMSIEEDQVKILRSPRKLYTGTTSSFNLSNKKNYNTTKLKVSFSKFFPMYDLHELHAKKGMLRPKEKHNTEETSNIKKQDIYKKIFKEGKKFSTEHSTGLHSENSSHKKEHKKLKPKSISDSQKLYNVDNTFALMYDLENAKNENLVENYDSDVSDNDDDKNDLVVIEEEEMISEQTVKTLENELSNVNIYTPNQAFEINRRISSELSSKENSKEINKLEYEGEILTMIDDKPEIIYLKLREKHLYFYKDKTSPQYLYIKFFPLEHCYFRENKPKTTGKDLLHSFTIQLHNSSEYIFYDKDRNVITTWVNKLREVTDYRNILDFYDLGTTINKGSFAIINLGSDLKTGVPVAIKIITKEEIKKHEEWNQLKTEIDVMKMTKHPNIIRYIDYFENSFFIFIVMEYLNYGTLQDFLKKMKFKISEKVMASIVIQIANVIKYLYTFGIVHRDLKPSNILLKIDDENNLDNIEVKVIDFGLSKILGRKENVIEECGSLGFCAPEIILGKSYNIKVDIWSLGVIIYYMCCKELPFDFKNENKAIAKTSCNADLKFTNPAFYKLSPSLIDLIKNCLEKNNVYRISIDKLLEHDWFNSFKFKLTK